MMKMERLATKTPEEIDKLKKETQRMKENQPIKKSGSNSKNQIKEISENRIATAPYNFVPLNNSVVQSEFSNSSVPEMDKYHDLFTGFIEINLESLTPLYIRDTLTEEESKEKERNDNYVNSNFYNPSKKLGIPGSSLRGLTRAMVEICSYGKFGFFDDKTLYFRDFTKAPLKQEYKNYVSHSEVFKIKNEKGEEKEKTRDVYSLNCGLLIKRGINFSIEDYGKPSRILKQPKMINDDQKRETTQSEKSKLNGSINNQNSFYQWFKTSDGNKIIVISKGFKPRDKNNNPKDWVIKLKIRDNGELKSNKIETIPLLQQDIIDYKTDVSRGSQNSGFPDLLKLATPQGIPIFFIKWQDTAGKQRISFGHTGMFRLPYKKSIGEHIPAQLLDNEKMDIAEALFGIESKFASRLFFEDAFVKSSTVENLMNECSPKILSGPKPTSFQNYLIQTSDSMDGLNHYNSAANPRGNKLYWHHENDDWIASPADVNKNQNQYTKIKPVKSGTSFTGRIRFENLSEVELGALLFALDLPDGCAHKIGMGKPLGLGSVRIYPSLHLSDRKERYKNLSRGVERDSGDRWPRNF